MAQLATQMILSGLGTMQSNVSQAGTYLLTCTLSLPAINKGDSANSQVVTVVKQNGSTIYTGLAGSEGFQINLACAAGDIIAVQTTSSAAVDQNTNVIKAQVAIG